MNFEVAWWIRLRSTTAEKLLALGYWRVVYDVLHLRPIIERTNWHPLERIVKVSVQ
jgi:hypothetical protein